MSLHIYFNGIDSLPTLPILSNVDAGFNAIALVRCKYTEDIIKSIELGSYKDENSFIDRFGNKLDAVYLSIGTKAALLLYYESGSIVSGIEIGRNALTEIIKNCSCGYLLLPASNYYVEREIVDITIDVVCKGIHFTSLDEFSKYMMEDAPYDRV